MTGAELYESYRMILAGGPQISRAHESYKGLPAEERRAWSKLAEDWGADGLSGGRNATTGTGKAAAAPTPTCRTGGASAEPDDASELERLAGELEAQAGEPELPIEARFDALDIPALANDVPVVLAVREGTGPVVALRVGEAIDLYKAGRRAGWKPGGGDLG